MYSDSDASNVHQYWQALKRRWIPATIVAGSVFALTASLTVLQKPIFEAQGKLLFNKTSRVTSLTSLTEKAGEMSGLTQLSNPLDTEGEVIRSQPLVRKTIAALELRDADGNALSTEAFLKRLTVRAVRGTDVLALSYRSSDPKEASAVVNSVIQNYLENNIRTNRAEAIAAREFITKQLPDVEARVAQAELMLRRFKERHRVVALEEEAKGAVGELQELSNAITKAQAELAETQSRAIAIQGQLGLSAPQAVALTALSQSKAVQQVLTQYHEAQDKLAVEKTRYQANHPEMVNLTAKAAALRSQLNQRIQQTVGAAGSSEKETQFGELQQALTRDLLQVQADRQGVGDRVAVLQTALSAQQQRINQMPQLEQHQRELDRQLQVARSTYEQLLKRLQEVQVVENQNVGNARVVSAATVPDRPISPKILLNLLVGAALGLVGGLAIAFLLESMDKSVKTVEETKQLLHYPLLGTIVQMGRSPEPTALPVRDNPYSPVSAAFEMLETTLGFTVTDRSLNVLAITSALPTEGKSFVTANLAVTMAQMGKRVLLIDADMRRPTQHEIWNHPNFKGLSDVLVGQSDVRSAVKEVLINLDVLTAGTIPPNPMGLLQSQQLATLLETVRKEYDCVIIDTPPIALTADGLTIGKLADGMAIVVRPGVVNTDAIRTIRSLLAQASIRVLGIVANGITSKTESGGYYSSDRYYGYRPKSESGEAGVKTVSK